MLWSQRSARRARADRPLRPIELYRLLIATAPTETVEQVHLAAFARLGELTLVQLYEELSHGAGTGERPRSSEPVPLARAVARRELRQPGSLELVLRRVSPAVLLEVAELVIAEPLASAFLPADAARASAALEDRIRAEAAS